MKRQMLILCSIMMISCQYQQDSLIGKWKVNSKFLNATYQILEDGDELNGLVLFYDDGTTKYRHDGTKNHYVFKGLKKENEQYVDGISGATTKENNTPRSIEITKKHKDTLEVTTLVMNKPIVEFWTRQ